MIKSQPASVCNNGCPTNKFTDISSTEYSNSDILYGVYQSYQNTFTPNYISNNLLKFTNKTNYSSLPIGPSNIFIIRHAEKNKDGSPPTSQNTYYGLNCNGIKRSTEIPDFINNLGAKGYPITAIVTCNPSMVAPTKYCDLSTRPQHTITFSAWVLNIPLYIFSGENISQPYDATTAIKLFTNQTFHGKNVLIAFEHENIQSLTNQIVQCYNYFQKGGTIEKLNNSTLYNISTQEWWKQNTPVRKKYQYSGLESGQEVPEYPIPYKNYSELLPYWNSDTFDRVYWLSQTNTPNKFTFNVFNQNINTCFQNCNLLIGLIQYQTKNGGSSEYVNEKKCLPP
jgi:hypothetical protein